MRSAFVPVVAELLLLAACSSGPKGQLLYALEEEPAAKVMVVAAAGGPATELSTLPGAQFPAEPDPQGTHALVVTQTDHEAIWLVPLVDGDPVRLGPASMRARNPVWSTDGGHVVFESGAHSFSDLVRVSRDGKTVERLTSAPHGSFEPTVSRTGRLVFAASRDGNAELYLRTPDGPDQRLTVQPADDVRPRWSPDSSQIAWITHREGVPRVWLMGADGSGKRPLRTAPVGDVDADLRWSPDGESIAVTAVVGARDLDIHIIDVQTGAIRVTIGETGVDEHLVWSPDGRHVAWTRGGRIAVARSDGKNRQFVSPEAQTAWLPRWLVRP